MRGIPQVTPSVRFQERIELEFKLTFPQVMLVDKGASNVVKDLVQEEPGDAITRVCLDADVEIAAIDTVVENAVRDGILRAKLDVGADALAGVLEA